MSDRRRGLGRGLGALIPTASGARGAERPVDVFFPTAPAAGPPSEPPRVEPDGFTGNIRATEADGVVDEACPVGDDQAAAEVAGPDLLPVPGARFTEIPLDQITMNPRQPRQVFDADDLAELVHSIREIGVLQPIVVRPRPPTSDSHAPFELVMGERRWRACREAGLERVPAIVRDTGDDALLRDALLENLHRSDLNPLEEAAAYVQLLEDFGCTHDELATRIGRSRPQITNTMRLLRLPPLVQRRVAAGVLSAGHARALLGLDDGAAIERLALRVVAEGLSVRATEEMVSIGSDLQAPAERRRARPGERHGVLDDLAGRLSDRLDTRVKIALGQRKGRITVEFGSVEDLDRILGVLVPDEAGVFRATG